MMRDLEIELEIANETIIEAAEAFEKMREEYQALREHTDKLEALLKDNGIPFQSLWGW